MNEDIQALVDEKLDLAMENGYDQRRDAPSAVANDMISFDHEISTLVDAEFDGNEEKLIPYIQTWQTSRSN